MESPNKNQITELLKNGNELYCRGDFTSALEHYQKILKLDSDNLPALVNVAQSYFELKNYPKAEQYAEKVLHKNPDSLPALSLMGCLCFAQDKYDESAAYFQQALKLDSTDVWNHNYLSQALQKNGDFAQALAEAYTALELSGGEESQQLNYAYALYETAVEKGVDFIRPQAEKWYKKYRGFPLVDYVYAALRNNPEISRADETYVRLVFDNFAESFEEALANLNYRVPQLIADSLAENFSDSPPSGLRILDLGCGTGLVAQHLLPLVRNPLFTGVDLSAGMLAEAAKKDIYNQLVEEDLASFLAAEKNRYDWVIAADVLTYFGELKTIFAGVFSILNCGGKFIFSVSQNRVNSAPWHLHLSGRFLHSETYLREGLSAAGFAVEKFSAEVLREEGGEPVWGWIITAAKSDGKP